MNSLLQVAQKILSFFGDCFLHAFDDGRFIPYQLLVVLCVLGIFRFVFSFFGKDDNL